MQRFAGFCGILGLENSRDAFIIAICKASLPPQYALNVLNVPTTTNNSSLSKLITFTVKKIF